MWCGWRDWSQKITSDNYNNTSSRSAYLLCIHCYQHHLLPYQPPLAKQPQNVIFTIKLVPGHVHRPRPHVPCVTRVPYWQMKLSCHHVNIGLQLIQLYKVASYIQTHPWCLCNVIQYGHYGFSYTWPLFHAVFAINLGVFGHG